MPNRLVCGSPTNWRASSGSCASPWASVVRWGSGAAHVLRRGLGRPAAGEQPQGAALRGVDQLGDLVEVGLGQAVAARGRQVSGHVEDRLLAVVERRADVEPLPGRPPVLRRQPERRRHGVEVAAQLEGGRGEHGRLLRQQPVAHRAGDLERSDRQVVAAAVALPLAQPEHVLVGAGRHPLGGHEDLLRPALGLRHPGVRRVARLARERRDEGARRVADQGEGVGELLGLPVDPARRTRLEVVPQRLARVREVVGLGLLDVPLRAAGGPVDVTRGQLVGRRLGDPGDQLVGLVDHGHVVLRDHRHALDRVDR